MTFRHCVAVDLGASSGRVMLATQDCDLHTLTLREMHRFANCLQKQDGFVTRDIDARSRDPHRTSQRLRRRYSHRQYRH